MSITVKRIDNNLWTIGFLDQAGWTPLRDCSSLQEVMAWWSYLNGGVHPNEIEGYWNKTYWQDHADQAMK